MTRPATHRALLRCLQGLGAALTAVIDRPNYGGCGVIAGIVGQELERLGVECDVVTPVDGYRESKPADVVRAKLDHNETNSVSNWDANGLSRGHLAVRFMSNGKLYTWDTDGVRQGSGRFGGERKYKTAPRFGTGLTVQECVQLGDDSDAWNSSFDRDQIPDIQRKVREYLGCLVCPPAT